MIFIPLNALDEIEVNMIFVKRYEFVVNALNIIKPPHTYIGFS